jgi:hypothetical protein
LSLKRLEKTKQLLLKRATEEALLEKTADARPSDGAADEDDPVRITPASATVTVIPTVGAKCPRGERAYATG